MVDIWRLVLKKMLHTPHSLVEETVCSTSTLAPSPASPPGYYTVSFSAHADVGGSTASSQFLYLCKNGSRLDEAYWNLYSSSSLSRDMIGVCGSRIVVSARLNLLKTFARKLLDVNSPYIQILRMDAGDTLELRMTNGDWIYDITLNIELTGLGFDFLV